MNSRDRHAGSSRIIHRWLIFFPLAIAPASYSSVAIADEPLVIPLWEGVAPGSEGYTKTEQYDPRSRGEGIGWVTHVSQPTLKVYLPAVQQRCGTGIVVCPGGGYSGLAIEHEGYRLAQWFAERGVVAAVLKYRHGGGQHQHPIPLNDAQRSLRIMRSKAAEWKLDEAKIGIAGFSAGGHLASTTGTHFDVGNPEAADAIERVSCRPDFLVLAYPVISMQEGVTHNGSKKNLLGHNPTEELVQLLSSEQHVTDQTGPTFITHAADDGAVPVENAIRFYRALCQHQVPAELHVYATGGHGYGMLRRDRPADRWPVLLEGWLKTQNLIP